MRFTVAASDLKSAVSNAALAVERSGVAILECLNLSVSDNTLSIIGTNLEVIVRAHCECAAMASGSCSVNASDFKAVCGSVSGDVSFELKDSMLRITSGRTNASLLTLADQFPSEMTRSAETEIKGGVEAIGLCAPFASTDSTQPNFCGVIFDTDTAVSSTGRRFFATPISGGKGQIVPTFATRIASKLGGRLFLGERHWRIESESSEAVGRLLDYKAFDWRRIVFDAPGLIQFDADEMRAAIESATLKRASWAVIEAANGEARISGDKFGDRHVESACTIPCAGEVSIVVKAKDVTDALAAFSGEMTSLHCNGAVVLLRPENSGQFALTAIIRDSRNKLPVAA